MNVLSSIRTLLAFLFRRQRVEQEMEEELRLHLRSRADDLEKSGLPRAEAERQARIEFGGYQRYKEECREALGTRLLGELIADIRFGLRQLRRNPGFTAVAVLTLALGIGANTAIFSLIDAVMLRAMPVRNPSQLVLFRWKAHHAPHTNGYATFGDCPGGNAGPNPSGCAFPYPVFEKLRSESNVFSGVAAFGGAGQLDVSGNGPPSIVHGELVSGDFFSTLGVNPALGRLIDENDDTPSSQPAAVLSYAYWQTAFGGDKSVLGRMVVLNNVPFTIIGVTDQRFTHLTPGKTEDFWLPLAMGPRLGAPWAQTMNDNSWWLVVVGRLRPGVSVGHAQAAASLLFRNEMLHGAKPLSKPQDNPAISLVPAQEGLTGLRFLFSTPLYVLMGSVGIILLIACANVAGLLLARGTVRYKEMAVRLAVGAGRGRICRQLLTESVLLSSAGGALGILFAYWGVHAIAGLMSTPWGDPFPFEVKPDPLILFFTVSISLLTGILFGLAPALRSTRVDLTPALKESACYAPEQGRLGRRFQLGGVLVVAQVGLSVVVLVGAGLMVRTLENLRSINPGFDTRNLLLFGINPTLAGYKDAQAQSLYRTLQERLAALPGVQSVSYSTSALLSGSLRSTDVRIEGSPAKKSIPVDDLAIGPTFLHTLRIPLLEGRAFTGADFRLAAEANDSTGGGVPPTGGHGRDARAATIPVLVNRTFVQTYLRNQNSLGKRLVQSGNSRTEWEIVGVVGDAKYHSLKAPIDPTVYIPKYGGFADFELRTAGNPTDLIPVVRKVASQLDSRLPLFDLRTQSQAIDQSLVSQRSMAQLASLFGALAALLACVGLYGLLSYEVTRRTREIGIRIALGAKRDDVLRIVVGRGLRLALLGIGAGVFVAFALTRFLASLLYGVRPTDPATFAVISLVVAIVALFAGYIPARRATKVDPMVALRYE